MTRGWIATAALVACCCLQAAGAAADQIRLKNGNVLEGTIKSRTERQVVVTLPDVGDLTMSTDDIVAIEVGAAEPPEAAQEAEEVGGNFRIFHNGQRGVRLSYPTDWRVTEHDEQHPYVVNVLPEPRVAPDEVPPVVIELIKHYHASGTMGFDHRATNEELLDRAEQSFTASGGRVAGSTPWELPRGAARLLEADAVRPGQPAVHLLLLLAAKRDTLVTLFCQVLPDQFEAHRAVFDEVLQRAEPFARVEADTAQLDRRTRAIEQDGMEALQAGDAGSALERLRQAVTLNPGMAGHHLTFGTALIMVGRQAAPDQRNALFSRAEQELRLAVALFPVTDDPKASAPQQAQALYLLGELAAFGRGSPALAKQMYEAALAADPKHPGAQQALQRYQGGGAQ